MIEYCVENLQQIKILLQDLTDENFKKRCDTLFSSTVGQHVRHILEFYICLLNGIESGVINYDKRKRQKELETETELSISKISKIITKLENISEDRTLEVKANFGTSSNQDFTLNSSVYRELGYCLEHSVHHQALIKTALQEHQCLELITKSFGVAASTIRNRNTCAQ